MNCQLVFKYVEECEVDDEALLGFGNTKFIYILWRRVSLFNSVTKPGLDLGINN